MLPLSSGSKSDSMDVGNTFLRNVGTLLPDYTSSHLRLAVTPNLHLNNLGNRWFGIVMIIVQISWVNWLTSLEYRYRGFEFRPLQCFSALYYGSTGLAVTCRFSFVSVLGVGWDWVHLVHPPLFGLLYRPRMIDECGAFGWVRIGRGSRSNRKKKTCSSVPLSTRNLRWPDLESKSGRRCGKPLTNRLNYGTAAARRLNPDVVSLRDHSSVLLIVQWRKWHLCELGFHIWGQFGR
jgi:hypothetical protein